MGLQAFKAIKYFIISGTNNKIGCLFTWVFWWVLLAGFLGGFTQKKPTGFFLFFFGYVPGCLNPAGLRLDLFHLDVDS